jgi:hypothetical protein
MLWVRRPFSLTKNKNVEYLINTIEVLNFPVGRKKLTSVVTPSTNRVSLKVIGLSSSTCPTILSGTTGNKYKRKSH